jgi:protein-export membrane protein SecD
MQSWKIASRARQGSKNRPSGRKGKDRVFAVLLLVLTLAMAVYDFPQLWNGAAGFVQEKSGWNPPRLVEHSFRLGLDLQGGTHLVYEADMKDIPVGDRATALEGVRDVIERRVNAYGVSEPVVQTVTTGGVYRIIVELAGVLDVNEAIALIGGTPVLEFKEPGLEVGRELTAEELAKLAEINKAERAAAQAALVRAQKGESFDSLVQELSVDPAKTESNGKIDGMTLGVPAFAPIVRAILDNRVAVGRIVPKVVETERGLNIVKYLGTHDSHEMLLSDIVICFEGKTGCASARTALDASVIIQDLKQRATAENFAQLARENSDQQGLGDGEIGWVLPGERAPAYMIEAAGTPVGAISDVVEDEFGYHLLFKQDERTVRVYDGQRILMPLSGPEAVIPNLSPWKNTALSGKHLKSASVQFDPQTGVPHVALQFNDEGATLFAELTASHVGEPIAIFLDGQPISTPVVQTAIYGGQAVITGNSTVEEAKLLAQRLNAGALPVPVTLLSQQTVGPTLGSASLDQSIKAGLIGFALIAAYMVAYYRLAGLFSVVALVLYAFLNLAVYRLFGVTITLSGIAGFVLSMGMAVDANVLIIERMKEELASGRDLDSSMREGFARAWPAIRDSNVASLVSALVLYLFSASFIRGFALLLGIGVVISLFTAVTATRLFMRAFFPEAVLRFPILSGLPKSPKS